MNKVIAIILTICILFIILTACVNDDENTEDKGDAQRDGVTFVNTHFEMYTYEWEQLELPSSVNYVQVALTHEGRIYYAYLEYNTDETSTLIISNIKPNGNDEQRIEVQSFANDIASFNITNDGNFAFLLFNRIITSQGISLSVHYVEYDNNGTELIRRDINEFLLVSNPQPNTFLLLKDGRILFINSDENIIVEFDFDNNSWGDKLLLADETGRVHTLYPVGENTDFDFLLSDGTFLYGYNIEKNEQTLLLSWIVTGFANVDNAKVGIFEDGRVFVITGDNNPIDEKNIELHILTPISREE
ncbi:MAG: hypothetical protein LBC73_04710, partial [Oscillospiraceae bacterium]|nr:hypothetical protein [Oscillospiraceae bacterium]